jgi:Ca2+-transporting ATPase
MLLVLVACAPLSFGFGIKSDKLCDSWYDGYSIVVADAIIVLVTGIANCRS